MEVEAGSAAAARRGRRKTRRYSTNRSRVPEFPGCRPVLLTRDELATWEGRLEFWDAATKTAWVVRDGTEPDDTLWLQAHREQGRARGQAEGRAQARAELMDALRRNILASRGLAGISNEEILDALLESEDQADFRARLERPRR